MKTPIEIRPFKLDFTSSCGGPKGATACTLHCGGPKLVQNNYTATLRNLDSTFYYFWTPHVSVWTAHFG